jgi:hypothetical protein
MNLVVLLSSAQLCFAGQCYPALVGADTPTGTFALHRRYVQATGYGGDVLQFAETRTDIMAIHRVWLGRPAERRAERLARGDASQRRFVTRGCINIEPAVYERIVDADTLTIEP